jgi:hypothetical protein
VDDGLVQVTARIILRLLINLDGRVLGIDLAFYKRLQVLGRPDEKADTLANSGDL